jgi:phosphopantetheinyl transferase
VYHSLDYFLPILHYVSVWVCFCHQAQSRVNMSASFSSSAAAGRRRRTRERERERGRGARQTLPSSSLLVLFFLLLQLLLLIPVQIRGDINAFGKKVLDTVKYWNESHTGDRVIYFVQTLLWHYLRVFFVRLSAIFHKGWRSVSSWCHLRRLFRPHIF